MTMPLEPGEQTAIANVLEAGARYGYGKMILHLQRAWATVLVRRYKLPEEAARAAAGIQVDRRQ